MQIRHLILTILTALTLTGCNSLGKKPESNFIKVANHPETPHATELSTTVPAKADAVTVAQFTELESRDIPIQPAKAKPLPPTDLMDRLRAGFSLEIPNHPRIETQVKWYASHGDYLDRVQQRATPYLHFIIEEAEKRGVPTELALLPIVESGFQPFAYSPGRAAGLWQFIPSTGKHYGLQQNWWYDGRRDVVAATNAALDYLSSMAKQF